MVVSKGTDRRMNEALRFEERALRLRGQVEADRVKDFPKIGELVRVRDDQAKLVFGLHDKLVAGHVGVVMRSWPDMREIILEFRDIPVLCGECGKRKAFETCRLRFPEECEKASD